MALQSTPIINTEAERHNLKTKELARTSSDETKSTVSVGSSNLSSDATEVLSHSVKSESTIKMSANKKQRKGGDEDETPGQRLTTPKTADVASAQSAEASTRSNTTDDDETSGRIQRKRENNVIYSRRKREKKKMQIAELCSRRSELERENEELTAESNRLETLLSEAQRVVTNIELTRGPSLTSLPSSTSALAAWRASLQSAPAIPFYPHASLSSLLGDEMKQNSSPQPSVATLVAVERSQRLQAEVHRRMLLQQTAQDQAFLMRYTSTGGPAAVPSASHSALLQQPPASNLLAPADWLMPGGASSLFHPAPGSLSAPSGLLNPPPSGGLRAEELLALSAARREPLLQQQYQQRQLQQQLQLAERIIQESKENNLPDQRPPSSSPRSEQGRRFS